MSQYIEIEMIQDSYLILNHPDVARKFPQLFKEVSEHNKKSMSTLYSLSEKAYQEYSMLTQDRTLVGPGLIYS